MQKDAYKYNFKSQRYNIWEMKIELRYYEIHYWKVKLQILSWYSWNVNEAGLTMQLHIYEMKQVSGLIRFDLEQLSWAARWSPWWTVVMRIMVLDVAVLLVPCICNLTRNANWLSVINFTVHGLENRLIANGHRYMQRGLIAKRRG